MEEKSWLIEHPAVLTFWMPVVVGMITATAGYFKTRAAKATSSKNGIRQRRIHFGLYFGLIALASLVSGWGAHVLTKYADRANVRAQKVQEEMTKKMDKLSAEFRRIESEVLLPNTTA